MSTPRDTTPSPGLRFACSDPHLEQGFAWAVPQALSRVRTGDRGAVPSYWAALTDRPMFYSRDVAHQALGAHLLGLDRENFSMLRHFAASATAARGFYPLWAFTFDGAPAAIDYVDDTRFVRETPAAFEIAEKSVEQYLWTGDDRYLSDPVFTGYYRDLLREFVPRHDILGTGVAGEQDARDIFAGSPTYNEMPSAPDMQVASDGIACQWAATAAIAAAARDKDLARQAQADAERLRLHFERDWWDEDGGHYLTGISARRTFGEFAFEPSWFPAVKRLLPHGDRAEAHLAFLDTSLEQRPPSNIEAFTYLPEAFFAYDHDTTAIRWIRHLIDSRALYPEVPFTVVSHLCTGLTGVVPRHDGALETRSHLAEGWVEVEGLPYRDMRVAVRHDGHARTTLTLQSGTGPLQWVAHVGDRTVTHLVEPGQSTTVTA
ncbi:hypothetical protein [Streptomyces gilvus]|uniref:hypothetical protein n=1 Tax=Streptomyces gilvus TaxID=2920937 RepID=UPI001F112224|nr:hypothetical protein [Streptomyces sp. CME 23]MCH5674825.1 hypothetical protein [Streptomyces sp. CME 23]